MRKTIIIVILILISGSLLFSEGSTQSGILTFTGFIPDGVVDFKVSTTLDTAVDLLSSDVDPTSGGVEIGKWSFELHGRPASGGYTVSYVFKPLEIDNTHPSIAFELIESGGETNVIRSSGSSLTIGIDEAVEGVERTLHARLTTDGLDSALGAYSGEYQSHISVTLSKD
ncbi:MAG: hypothetical protein ACOX0W_04500 [Sphaerochaetaceae bacterium]|jgi:hypothetical protein